LLDIKLSDAGFDVRTASDGEEGLSGARAERPDLVLVEAQLPKLDGYAVTRALKEHFPFNAPLIMMLSSRGRISEIAEGLRAGADDYVLKPFSPSELIERMIIRLIQSGREQDVPMTSLLPDVE
jgi:two-component system alkaline phosphatase synthesis response regulator PhoP